MLFIFSQNSEGQVICSTFLGNSQSTFWLKYSEEDSSNWDTPACVTVCMWLYRLVLLFITQSQNSANICKVIPAHFYCTIHHSLHLTVSFYHKALKRTHVQKPAFPLPLPQPPWNKAKCALIVPMWFYCRRCGTFVGSGKPMVLLAADCCDGTWW